MTDDVPEFPRIIDRRHGRTKPRSWLSLFGTFAAAIVLVSGLSTVYVVGLYRSIKETRAFATDGVDALAQVIERHPEDRKVLFRFDVDGETVEVWEELPKALFRWSVPGNRHAIRYMAHNPQEIEAYTGATFQDRWNFAPFSVLLLAIWFIWFGAHFGSQFGPFARENMAPQCQWLCRKL
ncbi:MAG: hypothetical protein AAFX00_13770 [Pseudomonadota bacterium]